MHDDELRRCYALLRVAELEERDVSGTLVRSLPLRAELDKELDVLRHIGLEPPATGGTAYGSWAHWFGASRYGRNWFGASRYWRN